MFKASGIVFDTDGQTVDLPNEMTVQCDDIEDVADAISEETGWLVESIEEIIEK